MSDDLTRNEILSAGPDDGDWSDVISRASRARRRYQVRAAVLVTALVVVGAASAYALTHHGQPWCKEKPGEAWKKTLASHVVELSRHVSVAPIAIAGDGHSFYAEIYSKSYSGIVKIDAITSHYVKIQRDTYWAMGSADERWFVWADQVNGYGATRAIWSWDSRTGRLRRIMAPRRSIDGEWPSASNPVVRGDYATWSQGATDYVSDVHVVDLSNGRDRVIYSGSASEPFFLSGSVVAWVENVSAPKSKNPDFVLRAANALTGRRVTLPRGLRDLPSFGATTLVTDGGAFVYSPEWLSLWWSPSLATPSRRVFPIRRQGRQLENSLQQAGHYVSFQTQTGGTDYLVDASNGGYVKMEWPIELLNTKVMVFGGPSPSKAAHSIHDVSFVPLKSIPAIRSCPEPVTATG